MWNIISDEYKIVSGECNTYLKPVIIDLTKLKPLICPNTLMIVATLVIKASLTTAFVENTSKLTSSRIEKLTILPFVTYIW